MKKTFDWFVSEESGQGMVEYGLIIALVSIAAIFALSQIGGTLTTKFGEIKDALDGKVTAPAPGGSE